MSIYPDLKWPDNEHHLLFDVGFSYALLSRAQQVLRQARDTQEDEVLWEVIQAVIEDIDSFQQGRLQVVDEIYASAHELAKQGRIKT